MGLCENPQLSLTAQALHLVEDFFFAIDQFHIALHLTLQSRAVSLAPEVKRSRVHDVICKLSWRLSSMTSAGSDVF